MKTLDTLVSDIYNLFTDETNKPSDKFEEHIDTFLKNLKEVIKKALFEERAKSQETLRMSNIGVPDRQLWYRFNTPREEFKYSGSTRIKFLYGDILEQLLIFLVKEAGHEVTGEQDELEIEGIKGHRDCKINGVTTDIKTSSQWGFKKFSEGTLFKDDPFGYIAQISGYTQADGQKDAAFFAINKETGELALLKINEIDTINAGKRIKHLKEVLARKEVPEKKCYEPIPEGKSGNMKLSSNCSFCPFKNKCWADANNGKGLRKFKYANGVVELVQVFNEPRVEEIITI